jgi:indolepyruvate ferredoxin oxidoreductase
MTGLAQKNGAVVSHVRIGDKPEQMFATRIAAGEAKLVLACDILTGVGYEALAKMQKGVTKALVNTALVMPAQFTREPDLRFPTGTMEQEIKDAVAPGDAEFLDATRLATGLMGDSIATNLFMVGYAFQRGLVPLGEAAILRAIELNGQAIESNKQSFNWGRLAAVDPARVAAAAVPAEARPDSQRLSQSLDEMVARRAAFLTDYQDAAYAKRYADLVAQVRAAEGKAMPGITELGEAVARYYFKLLAIKDEYEVARLYAESDFTQRVAAQFEGDYKLTFHLAPPVLNKPDALTGVPKKSVYGPWMMKAFGVLAKLRRFRGTGLDFFGRTEERQAERALIGEYETVVAEIVAKLAPGNHATAVDLASVPEHIRGFGHVRRAHMATAKSRESVLLAQFRSPLPAPAPVAIKLAV